MPTPQLISFMFVGETPMLGPHCMIYKQTICECLLQKRVCWIIWVSPELSPRKRYLSVPCSALIVTRGASLWLVGFGFFFFFLSFFFFLFLGRGLCVSFGKGRGERSPPQSVHGQCCCKKTVLVAFVGSSMWTCSPDLETVTLPHFPPSQVEGWLRVGLWRPVLRILKTPNS